MQQNIQESGQILFDSGVIFIKLVKILSIRRAFLKPGQILSDYAGTPLVRADIFYPLDIEAARCFRAMPDVLNSFLMPARFFQKLF